jgi:hypothetical protein
MEMQIDLCDSGYGSMAAYCEHVSELSVSIKRGNLLSSLNSREEVILSLICSSNRLLFVDRLSKFLSTRQEK